MAGISRPPRYWRMTAAFTLSSLETACCSDQNSITTRSARRAKLQFYCAIWLQLLRPAMRCDEMILTRRALFLLHWICAMRIYAARAFRQISHYLALWRHELSFSRATSANTTLPFSRRDRKILGEHLMRGLAAITLSADIALYSPIPSFQNATHAFQLESGTGLKTLALGR